MEAMLRFGGDFPGAFVLGRDSLASALASRPVAIAMAEREVRYPELAAGALRGELIGSSAGGEQPKFVVEVMGDEVRPVLVKFSTSMAEPIGRRWADLLVAEHVAGSVLAANGFAVAPSEVIDAGGQRFLEVERFDRTAGGGRLPVISLRAVASALLDGVGFPWPDYASTLREQGWLVAKDADQLASAWRFGRLIANTDMHEGNASLIFTPERPVRLAPIYDMLPMAYRPGSQGQIPGTQETQLALCAKAPACRERDMALTFWDQLAGSDRVSAEFAEIASQHARALAG
jgi:serine/threonine protein kinase HipA of HipAB toxin-antitoxin module